MTGQFLANFVFDLTSYKCCNYKKDFTIQRRGWPTSSQSNSKTQNTIFDKSNYKMFIIQYPAISTIIYYFFSLFIFILNKTNYNESNILQYLIGYQLYCSCVYYCGGVGLRHHGCKQKCTQNKTVQLSVSVCKYAEEMYYFSSYGRKCNEIRIRKRREKGACEGEHGLERDQF